MTMPTSCAMGCGTDQEIVSANSGTAARQFGRQVRVDARKLRCQSKR